MHRDTGASDTDGTAFHWRAWGRGKRSVVLDLQTADGIDALHRLLASADILLETATSAERTAWGVNVDDVADAYPGWCTSALPLRLPARWPMRLRRT